MPRHSKYFDGFGKAASLIDKTITVVVMDGTKGQRRANHFVQDQGENGLPCKVNEPPTRLAIHAEPDDTISAHAPIGHCAEPLKNARHS